jgi:predicted nuclease of restriction endonuclease-like (RecB) superfamily
MNDMANYREAVKEIKNAILQSRYRAAEGVNGERLALYYNVGQYVSNNSRSGKWGSGAIEAISGWLQKELPGIRGFSPTNMKYMRIFFEEWHSTFEPNRQLSTDDLGPKSSSIEIRHLPSDEMQHEKMAAFLRIGFTHHIEILVKCKVPEERWYYIYRCATEFWSVDTLKSHIANCDYTAFGALPNNFNIAIPNEKQANKAVRSFKDEYLLNLIDIEDETEEELIDEPELQRQIVMDIQRFIMTFGKAFCFIGSKYRIIVEEKAFYIDLLFFHRELDCLVAIELKRGEFKPAYLGQLNFYLSALDEYVKLPDENPSIGIILCKEAQKTLVEFAVRDFKKPMGVAVYKTKNEIPPEYKSLLPIIDGVQQLLDYEDESEDKE